MRVYQRMAIVKPMKKLGQSASEKSKSVMNIQNYQHVVVKDIA